MQKETNKSSESENEEDRPFHSQKPQGSVGVGRYIPAQPSLPTSLPSSVPAHSSSPMSPSVSSSVSTISTSAAASLPVTVSTPMASTTQSQNVQYIEATTTVKVPILRPRPGLLKVVQLGGGVGETFTMGEIIHHVKDYILERTLYDQQDPKIVHCKGDLLGMALKVDSFTIHDAIALFRKNCILEPDSRIRIRRHLVTRATSSHQSAMTSSGTAAYTTAVLNAGTETTTATASSLSNIPSDSCRLSPDSTRLSQDSEPFSSQSGPPSSALSSFSLSQPSSSFSSSGSSAIGFKAAQSSVTVTDSDLERCQGEQAVTSTDSSSDGGCRQRTRGMPRRREGANKSDVHKRKRSTSINVTYDEPDGAAGPWACEVRMETSAAEMAKAEDVTNDTVVLEYDSDTFSVEYEVESDSDNEGRGQRQEDPAQSESDVSSSTSNTALLVVCKESDVEYLADYSDSDNGSDTELTDADKWQCEYCSERNPPFQRNCAGCWSVRPDWLPSSSGGMGAEREAKPDSQESLMTLASGSLESTQPMSQESASIHVLHCSLDQSHPVSHSKNDLDGGDVKSSPKKRKYSSCLSTSDSQEEKLKQVVDEEAVCDFAMVEMQSDESRKLGKKKPLSVSLDKDDPCMVCLTRRKTASIIHGKTGHQVCCYRCARRLKKQRKSCPICRRPIQKVIRNYHL